MHRLLATTLIAVITCLATAAQTADSSGLAPTSGSSVLEGFTFDDGSVLDLRQHYYTLGTPRRGADGRVEMRC